VAFRPFDYAQGTLFGKKRDLKKQSQFLRGKNEYKYLKNKVLCKFMPFWAAKKQSQFHALKSRKGQAKIERSTYSEGVA